MNTSQRKLIRALCSVGVTLALFGLAASYVDRSSDYMESLQAIGWPFWLGYVVLVTIAGGFGVPPILLIVPAAGLWEFPLSLSLCMAGGWGASMFGFIMARYWIQETVTPKIPPRILRFEKRLETHAFSTVFVMRLLFYLFPPITWMLGVSRIPLGVFALATLAGMLPGTVLYVLVGQGLIGFLLSLSTLQSILIGGMISLVLCAWLRWVIRTG